MRNRLVPVLALPILLAAVATPSALALPGAHPHAHAHATTTTGVAPRARGTAVDTSSRTAVTLAWTMDWLPASRQPIALAGGPSSSCHVYAADALTQRTALAAYNFMRGLDGLDPLTTLQNSHLGQAEKGALIMAANNNISHYPPKSWSCYSQSGAAAAKRSDLGYLWNSQSSWLPTVGQFIRVFMNDPASYNETAPHRRWILRPEATSMANAYAIHSYRGGRDATNDLFVFPTKSDNQGATKPKFYAWPAKGWFPTGLEPNGRWSLSASSSKVHFKNATVKVTHAGNAVKVRRYTPAEGYADNTLVWQFAHAPARVAGTGERDYKVTVSHITGARPYSYTVRLFAP